MYERSVVAATMGTAPAMKTRLEMMRAHLRPTYSVTGVRQLSRPSYTWGLGAILKKHMRAPPRAPAWKAEVMLELISDLFSGVMPKSSTKAWRAIVVPMKAES